MRTYLCPIGDTNLYISDSNYSSKYPRSSDFRPEGVPFISANNLKDGRIVWDNMRFISGEQHASLRKGHLKAGDVLVSTRGHIGMTAHVTADFSDANINAQLVLLRADNTTIDSRYLYYALSSPEFASLAARHASGTAQPQLPIGALKNIPVRLHDFAAQKRIGSILSVYDDLIENNTRRIRILEEMAQMIYREWFVNFRFPGHETVEMLDSEMGPIPKGWSASSIGRLADDVRRSIDPTELDPEIPYIGLEHLPRKSIALSEWGKAGQVQSTKLRFRRGEILFGKIRPYFHKVGVAPVDGVCSSDAIVIMPKGDEWFPLVLCCVSSDDFVAQATQTSQGTKMPRANWEVLAHYPVVLPELSILMLFNNAIRPMVDLINNLIFRNRNLRTTRDLLLPKLISGEVSVESMEAAAIA
jgi:type I restriction enzyme, S subunit